ncbi:uncharacterized protein PV09_02482 [Verruconis gallopava]|uniref:F-box domain-containing protein n=1 Tax=Verruconis gallopava TaxID=253628 RepID=A0A0D1Z1I8_9PEZI|nr:uncharacterized protein PV09_02482 [Verruconis gallopava]KIW06802.1 hypothetical protein PV09_02482 [Verruconis gallopava]
MSGKSPLGNLCCLPLEVREIIYGYLIPPSRLPTILRSRHLGVSSISHRPPPLDLLLICSQLYVEALDLFYRKCVFKFDGLLDPANIWPLWQVEEVLGGSELGLVTLANMRKVELNLFWHRLPDGGVANRALANSGSDYRTVFKSEIDKRVERLGRAVQVLKRAEQLRTVVLTWKEIPSRSGEEPADWPLKEKVLRTLGALRGPKFVIGDLVASAIVERSILALIAEWNATDPESVDRLSPQPSGCVRQREYLDLVEQQQSLAKFNNQSSKHRSYFE